MFRIFLIFLLLASVSVPAKVHAEVYATHSPWNINYGKSSCDLKRIFKSNTDELQLQISQSFQLSGASLFLLTKPRDKEGSWEEKIEFSIDETSKKLTKKAFIQRIRKEDLLAWQVYGFDMNFLQNLPDAVTLRMKTKKYPEIALRLNGMKSVYKALEQCQRNLYASFGVDYSELEKLSKQPYPENNPGGWARAFDYPSYSLRRGHQGTVGFVLVVDSQGRTTDCIVKKSSGYASLDEQTCIMVKKRSRFTPALDQAGKPTNSMWASRVRWQIPK
ncbi:MAG: energy transducer TonB [Parasphingorhabdus sp.]|uniref:energy transducer TonB n=1 Tax=Parasphingorhabdus sp. TaxID=2709688 RepID=UPI0032985608